jgi:signal transduction histidine kinase
MVTRLSRPQAIVDVAIAVVYLVVAIAINRSGSRSQDVVIAGLGIALGFRRFSPGVALSIAWVTALFQMYFASLGPILPDLALLGVVYATAAHGGRTVKWLGFASIFVAAVLGAVYLEWGSGHPSVGVNVTVRSIAEAAVILVRVVFYFGLMIALLGLPWTAGNLIRTRLLARDSQSARARAELEASAAEQDVIALQERNRIARDMHDVVAHSLAVVIAQADGARYARQTDPAAVDDALSAISTTAREALADVRLLLGQLRHSQTEGPQPNLADLDRLLDQLRASGLTIAFETHGQPRPLGASQQLAVYRIVQEALTNALRHGDVSGTAVVRFDWKPDDLDVTISNSLVAAPATAELRLGHGLAGMKERAALVGGRLVTKTDDRNFAVTASVPATAPVPS